MQKLVVPLHLMRSGEAVLAFLNRIHLPARRLDCWLWAGQRAPDGYGLFQAFGITVMAHRFSYECAFGRIPPELVLDHGCHNRSCVNPWHLEAVTHRENIRRIAPHEKRIPWCRKGHTLDRQNTIITRNGKRICRACAQARQQEITDRRRGGWKRR